MTEQERDRAAAADASVASDSPDCEDTSGADGTREASEHAEAAEQAATDDAARDGAGNASREESDVAETDAEQDADRAAGVDQEIEQTPAAEEPPAPKPRRFLGFFVFILFVLMLGIGAGAGYHYYLWWTDQQLQVADAEAQQQARGQEFARLEQQLAAAQQRLDSMSSSLQAEQSQANATVAEQLAALKTETTNSLQAALNAAPPSERDWKVSEAAYLLRIANHRLRFERDVAGAVNLLAGADAILSELGDFSLVGVREQIASELVELKSLDAIDLVGLYLRLTALEEGIADLPLQVPEFAVAQPVADADAETVEEPAVTEEVGLVDQLTATLDDALGLLSNHIRVQSKHTVGNVPHLAPAERYYLSQNLRFMYEQAQAALLQGHQVLFADSLKSADEWLRQHFDVTDRSVVQALADIEQLRRVQIDTPLPDISGSLSLLRDRVPGARSTPEPAESAATVSGPSEDVQ